MSISTAYGLPPKFSEVKIVKPLNSLKLLHFSGSALNRKSKLPFLRDHVILGRLMSTLTDVERASSSFSSFLSLG